MYESTHLKKKPKPTLTYLEAKPKTAFLYELKKKKII